MTLLLKTINIEVKALHKNGVKFTIIGDLNSLPHETRKGLNEGVRLTKNNKGLNLCLALNYGSRQEMNILCQRICDSLYSNTCN